MKNEEYGVIVIPPSEWSSFRKILIQLYNVLVFKDYREACHLHPEIKKTGPYSKQKLELQKNVLKNWIGEGWDSNPELMLKWQRMEEMLFRPSDPSQPQILDYLQVPKLNKLPTIPVTGDVTIPMPYASISFFNATHMVRWSVQNEEGFSKAREHIVAKEFFRLLNATKWVYATGGKITRNGEVIQTFGKLIG